MSRFKLTPEQRDEIKRRRSGGEKLSVLSVEYGVSESLVSMLCGPLTIQVLPQLRVDELVKLLQNRPHDVLVKLDVAGTKGAALAVEMVRGELVIKARRSR